MLKVVPPEQMEEWSRLAREMKLNTTEQIAVADPAQTEPFSLNYDWFHEERLPKYFKTYEIKEYLTKGHQLLLPQKSFDVPSKPNPRHSDTNTNFDHKESQELQESHKKVPIQKGYSGETDGHGARPLTLGGHSNPSGHLNSADSPVGSTFKPGFKHFGSIKFNFSSSKDIKPAGWEEIGAIQPLPEMNLATVIESPGHNNASPEELNSPKKPRFTLAAMHQFKRRRFCNLTQNRH